MPPEGNVDPLQRLRARLYANQAPTRPLDESLKAAPQAPQQQWTPPPPPPPKPAKKPISWTVWFLLGAAFFCAIAVGIALFFLAQGGRAVSNDKVDITVQGPTTIASGTAVPLVITIQNHNPANLINATLDAPFPEGTRSAGDMSQALDRYQGTLGTIVAGGSASRTVQAVLFGSVNQSITIPVTLTFGAENSNATFTKTVNYTFTVTSSPLTITTQSLTAVSSGQVFTIAIAVRSNATLPLDNVAVAAQYPIGFTGSANGIATTSGTTYVLGTLQPGQEKDFTITGSLSGVDANEADLQFMVGTLKDSTSNQLDVAYASADTKMTIQQPFLATSLTLNNQSNDPLVISAGQQVAGTVSWKNTLGSQIANGQIAVKLSGVALDPTSVRVTNGYYNSSTNTIVFNGQTEASLMNLNPGDTGNGSFTFTTKTAPALKSASNPSETLSVSVAGRVSGGMQALTNAVVRHVQLASSLGLTSKILHSTGPFKNTGPWPPKVGNTTTYTVQLSIVNTVNPVAGAAVTAILPPYVDFTGAVSPADGSITYDSGSHKVTWKAGAIDAQSGIKSSPTTASFQISFTPSESQVGNAPVLVESQELTGTDRVTQAQIDTTADALTIEAPSDPSYNASFGIVSN